MKSSELILLVTMFVMLFGGGILGATTLWHLTRKTYYFWVTDLGVELASCVLMVAGSLLCFPACWVANNVVQRPKPVTYITLMILLSSGMLLFAASLTTASGLSRAVTPAALRNGMLEAMKHTEKNPSLLSWFDAMQTELQCCGVQSYTEWHRVRSSLPTSCCANNVTTNAPSVLLASCKTPLYARSCLRPALSELTVFIATTVSYSSCLIVIMAVALFVVAYLVVTEVEGERKPQLLTAAALLPTAPPPAPLYFPLPAHTSPTPSLL